MKWGFLVPSSVLILVSLFATMTRKLSDSDTFKQRACNVFTFKDYSMNVKLEIDPSFTAAFLHQQRQADAENNLTPLKRTAN